MRGGFISLLSLPQVTGESSKTPQVTFLFLPLFPSTVLQPFLGVWY